VKDHYLLGILKGEPPALSSLDDFLKSTDPQSYPAINPINQGLENGNAKSIEMLPGIVF
jgi:hypothetical protein